MAVENTIVIVVPSSGHVYWFDHGQTGEKYANVKVDERTARLIANSDGVAQVPVRIDDELGRPFAWGTVDRISRYQSRKLKEDLEAMIRLTQEDAWVIIHGYTPKGSHAFITRERFERLGKERGFGPAIRKVNEQ